MAYASSRKSRGLDATFPKEREEKGSAAGSSHWEGFLRIGFEGSGSFHFIERK
jgi:hypothetical protein